MNLKKGSPERSSEVLNRKQHRFESFLEKVCF